MSEGVKMVGEAAGEFEQLGLDPEDMRILEARQFLLKEVLAAYVLPDVTEFPWGFDESSGLKVEYVDLAAPRMGAGWAVGALLVVMVGIVLLIAM